jgi:hypothetical protein
MTTDPCRAELHPAAKEGLRLFNEGRYFEAHEALEEAWRAETESIREFYRGILQAAVVYLHITRNNYQGAVKVYERSRKWLRDWPDHCRGVNVKKLRQDLEQAIAEAQRLGPERLSSFDLSLLKRIESEYDPA